MTYLLLVRHSLPEIIPELSARQWRLSVEGSRRCRPLAEKMAAFDPALVVTSQEPKAQETGQLVAGHLGLAWETAADLHEHERERMAFIGQTAWEQQVAGFFAQPDKLVFGNETAGQARDRFTVAVRKVLSRDPEHTIAIVAHGTVMSLLVAAQNGFDPFPFWKSLALPDLVVLERPKLTLLSTH